LVQLYPAGAAQIVGSVAQAYANVTGGGTATNNFLDTLAAGVYGIIGVNKASVTAAITTVKGDPLGSNYQVGCLNPDETPTTNL
jgi:hypothetical protein